MKRTFILWGLWGLATLWMAGAAAAQTSTPEASNAPATDAELYAIVPDNGYLPLREVIRRYTGRTGVEIRLSRELRDDEETLKQLYSSRGDSWLEEFSRVEYDNQQTGKKEIILLKSRYYDASTIPDPAPPSAPRNPVQRVNPPAYPPAGSQNAANADPDAEKTVDGLSREKLFKLMRFPFKGPFSEEWLEDQDYRRFLSELQVSSAKDFEDRRVVMRIRNEARKKFREMRARR